MTGNTARRCNCSRITAAMALLAVSHAGYTAGDILGSTTMFCIRRKSDGMGKAWMACDTASARI